MKFSQNSSSKFIDLNCDMGESYGNFKVGNDAAIFPYITSCNIACGFHGGDPLHIEKTVKNALAHGVQIGAHPSYPDLAGFGRRNMQIAPNELRAIVKYQVAALKGMTESCGGRLQYVKPHGALYNTAAKDANTSHAIIAAIQEIGSDLILLGLAGSPLEQIALSKNVPFVAEAFADRRYEANGQLRSRRLEGAVIHEPEQAAQQVLDMVLKNEVQAYTGEQVSVNAQSICIHGDNPNAVELLQAIHAVLGQNGVILRKFRNEVKNPE